MRYLVGGMVLALALAGCTSPVAEPVPPVGDELQGYLDGAQFGSSMTFDEGGVVTMSEFDLNGNYCLEQAQFFLDSIDVTVVSDEEIVRLSKQFESEMSKCQNGILLAPNEAGFYSTAQLDYIYDYFQDNLIPCLDVLGFAVPSAPTRAQFSAEAGGISWDPYTALGGALPSSRSADVFERCPGLPAAGFLAGR